jgi:hypothetical protein
MDLYNLIVTEYPELATGKDEFDGTGSIMLRDDGDGVQYIAKWSYSKPIPKGLKLGK